MTDDRYGDDADGARGEELRLALVLNGGVSLAVWMGGVASELNRLVRETHPVYRGLLRLTSSTARIDVISGTSAGGVNGAALALAQVHDASLAGLREVWLDRGGIEQLMRDPADEEPPSLLRGDDHFLPVIERALADIAQGPAAGKEAVPMVLSLTATLLHGQGEAQLDDFGAVVEDTVHRARFVFERREGKPGDVFAPDSGIVSQLARAARAGASFPVAFEPALYKPATPPFEGTPLVTVGGRGREVKDAAYLLDGGILDNKPFAAALEGIAHLPAEGNTRRVLAYVVPDPKAAVEPPKPELDGTLAPPTLAQVAFQSAVGIPGTQSIADQLADIRDHSDYMRRRWQRIIGLLAKTPAGDVTRAAHLLFQAYRSRRLDGAIDYLLGELERSLAESPGESPVHLRRSTRQWLRALWLDTADDASLWGEIIPARFAPGEPLIEGATPQWHWGQYTLEFMADVLIDVLRRTQRLLDLVGRWQQDAMQTVPAPAVPASASAPVQSWEQLDRRPSPAGRRGALGAGPPGPLAAVWKESYAISAKLRERRSSGSREARDAGRAAFIAMIDKWSDLPQGAAPAPEAIALIRQLRAHSTTHAEERLEHARTLCRQLAALREPIASILAAHDPHRPTRADVKEALGDLKAYSDYFFRGVDAGTSIDVLAGRLLALEVIEVGAGSREHRINVGAEFVQISARQRSPWGGPGDPGEKLAGMGMAHFAAFYKRSWRANDWLFGRLDGIDRAVRIALNPDRLQRLYGQRRVLPNGAATDLAASAYLLQSIEALAVKGADPALRAELTTAWQRALPAIVAELAWLDRPSTVPPPVLEHCAAALTRRLHLEVLLHELPVLADAIDQDEAIGASASLHGQQVRARLATLKDNPAWAPDIALSLLRDGLLGGDTLAGEVGSDHFTRTVGQTIAVAHAAASSRSSGLKALGILLKLTEWPVRLFHWMASRLSRESRTNAAVQGAMLGTGVALVSAALLAERLPAVLAAIGWSLLAAALGSMLLRSWRYGVAAATLTIVLTATLAPAKYAAAGALLFLLFMAPGLGSLVLVAVAAWWTAGQPDLTVLRALPCLDVLAWTRACPQPAPVADLLQKADQLWRVGVPALLAVAFIALGLLRSPLRSRWRRWRSRSAVRNG